MIISTNILAKYSSKEFNYIVTPAASAVSKELFSAFDKRYRSFCLIGNYGTGKSSFLYALELSLTGKANYFHSNFPVQPIVRKCIGSYSGLVQVLSTLLGCGSTIDDIREKLLVNDSLVAPQFIFIDEFGKLVEYSLTNNPKEEIYNFQVISEFINNELNNTVLVTTLHQSFESYTLGYGQIELTEWEKVSGRFFPITFNDPAHVIAQIVLQFLDEKGVDHVVSPKVTSLLVKNGLLPKEFESTTLKGGAFGRLDSLTVYCAINLFRKYAQNERSIFTFLNDVGPFGIWTIKSKYYLLPDLYDYVVYRLGHVVYSNTNPDKLQWESAERAIQRSESHADINPIIAQQIIKSVHLVNLFAREFGELGFESLVAYFKWLERSDIDVELSVLVDRNILQYMNFKKRFVFVEGTDVNIELELKKAASRLPIDIDYVKELRSILKLEPVLSKRHLLKTGTPRSWFYEWSGESMTKSQFNYSGNGVIVLCFNGELPNSFDSTIHKKFPVVYVHIDLDVTVCEHIERKLKYDLVLDTYKDDRVVKVLLEQEISFLKRDIKHELLEKLVTSALWSYNGDKLCISSERSLQIELSNIFDSYFDQHPKVYNELVNRSKLSTSINTARKRLFELLLNNNHSSIHFEGTNYPPERMIYLSTIDREKLEWDGQGECSIPLKSTYSFFWRGLDSLVDETRVQRRPISDLDSFLKSPPIGMKEGLVKVLLGYYLIANRDSFALVHVPSGKFIPYLQSEALELVLAKPADFALKKFNFDRIPHSALSAFVKFSKLNDSDNEESRSARGAFYGIYAQLLRAVNDLPTYTQKTDTGIDLASRKFREAVLNALDPEQALLIALPGAFGLPPLTEETPDQLATFFGSLDHCVADLISARERLVDSLRFKFLQSVNIPTVDGIDQRKELKRLVSSIHVSAVNQGIKVLINRINSQLEDELFYWKAILDAVWGSSIDNIRDNQVQELLIRLEEIGQVLLALVGMSQGGDYRISVSIVSSDGDVKRKFVKEVGDDVLFNEHRVLLDYISSLEKQDRLAILGKLFKREME
jgi:hypothetical protein